MKFLVLVGDGMADFKLPEHGGRTPLEIARTPAMDAAAARGILGQFCPIPDGLPAGSDIGNLALYGYDPRAAFSGRAPLEAANQGITLAEDEVAFRCNLVTLDNGVMHSFTAGHISSEEGAAIIPVLNERLGAAFPVRFYPGVGYRHLMIVKGGEEAGAADLARLPCEPPHNISDKPVEPHLPEGPGAAMLRRMMEEARGLLAAHPVNEARIKNGNPPATDIWLWGQGTAPQVPPYAERFGLSGAVVSAVDLVMGIGRLAGLEVLKVPGATGWIDTNYEGKIGAALDALDRHDMAYVHLEAPDEAGHQGSVELKVRAIEDFDARIVQPALDYLERQPDTRIFIGPDHVTAIPTKTHAPGPVPFIVCGAGVTPNGASAYSERAAEATDVFVGDGFSVMPRMYDPAPITTLP